MTTIIAVQGQGWSLLGADTRSTDSTGTPIEMGTSKIVENNGFLIAGAGSVRGCNILQYGWVPPKPVGDLDKFMTRRFIPGMRKAFLEAGYDIKQDSNAAEHDSEFIVSVRGQVYLISDDYSWERNAQNIYAIGSGGSYALGAMWAQGWSVQDMKETESNMFRALGIAQICDVATQFPYHFASQKAPK